MQYEKAKGKMPAEGERTVPSLAFFTKPVKFRFVAFSSVKELYVGKFIDE